MQDEVSKIPAASFVCQANNKLKPITKIALKIADVGGSDRKQQCDDYIQQYGIIAGSEVVYTNAFSNNQDVIHVIANEKIMQSDIIIIIIICIYAMVKDTEIIKEE